MSESSYQGKNSIPHLTVRDPALPGEALCLYANPCCQCTGREEGIKFLVRLQRAEGPSTVSPECNRKPKTER